METGYLTGLERINGCMHPVSRWDASLSRNSLNRAGKIPYLKICREFLLLFFITTASAVGQTKELTAFEIVEASYKVYRGEDAYARLNFTFHTEDNRTSKVVMSMAWKNYHNQNGIDSKIIMFNEFPPDTMDVGFMAWLYDSGTKKQDDMWLYLPELMTVRKMGYTDNALQQNTSDQDYAKSELKRHELMPRHPQMDDHILVGIESIDGEECYIIESSPKDSMTLPYARRVQWITTANFLPVRIDYLNDDDKIQKQQSILWQNIDNVWTWDKVTAVNIETGNRTELEQTIMLINVGLRDDIFTKRMMKLGAKALKVKIGQLLE